MTIKYDFVEKNESGKTTVERNISRKIKKNYSIKFNMCTVPLIGSICSFVILSTIENVTYVN